ncbi:MAG: HIT family protein [Flaviflexus sp.]|uniref:HIT family protein n=1 Tax=Flaviflexus sp. TaxID=1969482 RepID=UPI00352E7BD5
MSIYNKIIDGDIPGRFVWADDICVAFATIEPHADGHVLVVPRDEIDKFTDLDDETASHLFKVARTIGKVQESVFDVPRAGLVIAGYGVPHCHLHVIPMTSEKELSFDSARKDEPQDRIDAAMTRLREGLFNAGHSAHVPEDMTSLK